MSQETTSRTELLWTFLPGLHGTGDLYHQMCEKLPKGTAWECVDLPTKGAQDYVKLTAWLDNHLDTQTGSKRLLIAESFSGPLALNYAALHPEQVAAIVLGASFCDAPLNPGIALLPLRPLFMVKPPKKALRHFLLGEDTSENQLSELRQTIKKIPSSTLTKRVRAILELVETDSPSPKDIPMLILHASEDNLIPWEAQQRLESRYPDARVHWINSPHFIFQQQPEQCMEKILDFVDGIE